MAEPGMGMSVGYGMSETLPEAEELIYEGLVGMRLEAGVSTVAVEVNEEVGMIAEELVDSIVDIVVPSASIVTVWISVTVTISVRTARLARAPRLWTWAWLWSAPITTRGSMK
jgi:chorismate mutase